MIKNPFKTFPIFYLLFLIFYFSLFPFSANACNCMCSFSGGAEQYVGTASDNNCSYFWCDASRGMSGSPHCATDSTQQSGTVNFTPQIGIPGSEFQQGTPIAVSNNTTTIANYVKAIYKYLIGIVGITAAIMLMVGGVVWLTAGGSPERVKQAQDYIVGSLTGLALALGSFLILGMINPALINFRISGIGTVANAPIQGSQQTARNCKDVPPPPKQGCCDGYCGTYTDENSCVKAGGSWANPPSGGSFTCDVKNCKNVPATTKQGCCDGYCGTYTDENSCVKAGGSWAWAPTGGSFTCK